MFAEYGVSESDVVFSVLQKLEALDESEVLDLYKDPSKVFQRLHADGKLRFVIYPEHEKSKAYSAWLDAV